MTFECEIFISNLVALTMGLLLLFLWYWKYIEDKNMEVEDLQEEIMDFRKKLREMSIQRNPNRAELYEYMEQLDQVKRYDALGDFEVLPPMPYVNEILSLEAAGDSN